MADSKTVQSILKNKTHHLAVLWQLTRTDGVIIRFTSHDRPLIFEGQTYSAAGGFQASAKQKTSGMKERNLTLIGFLSSDAITFKDLRAGRYRDAQIVERIVDWRFPFAGALATSIYWIKDTIYSGGQWEAQITGITSRLQQPIGDVYARGCRYQLGDARCKIDLDLMTVRGKTVTAITEDRVAFQADIWHDDILDTDGTPTWPLTGNTPDWFRGGKLTWLTGLNAGLISEVKSSSQVDELSGAFSLHLATPYDIREGDTFDVAPGCNFTLDMCHSKFHNLDNHGGFPTIPGTDKMLLTPNVKQAKVDS